ncbi:MAG TPA: PadR family transcriptional regulator [Gemmatimonadaceae bacterium]|nr:PadR family transcriptional regulator [Gemmatimonadaceae bacterium]
MPGSRRAAQDAPGRFLPLKTDVLLLLLALRDGERHGYALLREVAERSEGTVRLQTGALYRRLERLLDDGLVEESDRRPAPEADDERRRYYRLSPLGAAVLAAELDRLGRLVASATGTAPRRPRPA